MNGIMISNIWMTPLIGLLGDPMWFYKNWQKSKVRKFVETHEGGPYTQEEAHQIFLNNTWQISLKYSEVLKNFAVGMFYFPIMPYSIIYTFIYLVCMYWTQKVTQSEFFND